MLLVAQRWFKIKFDEQNSTYEISEPTLSFFSHDFVFIITYRNLGDPNFILYKITSSG